MQDRVKVPAIGLIITGVLGILVALGSAATTLLGSGFQAQEFGDDVPEIFRTLSNPAVNVGLNALSVLLSVVILMGGLKMKNLESRGFALTAALLAIVPCWGCCLTGIPFGIWAFVVLLNDEVKEAFRS